jgi:DNA invertase Pin-like site-specific DNA recombinase
MNRLNCAIYTRKSSDEGLDQEFNSLDAQREAGEAYIKSQSHEGWRLRPARYDDGGYSGGSMERPALKQLMCDLEAGLIDVVVVYKIDRLTRSLADFARIVERFDAKGVSFVSVTQAFNTTSSMGRLTLNVLLSFAQFEREVTGERIRDKIAASKAKGMWMGGIPPLGYDKPASGSRTLEVNETEAKLVRHIYARYLELDSVRALEQELLSNNIVSKRWTTASGRVLGGVPYSRGALLHLLRSRTYLGEIVHGKIVHEGLHDAIIERQLFDAVAAKLDARRRRIGATQKRVQSGYLAGRLFDAAGEAMTPTYSYGRSGRVYRYYVSALLQQGGTNRPDGVLRRISGPALERFVEERLKIVTHGAASIADILRIDLTRNGLVLTLPHTLPIDASVFASNAMRLVPGEGRALRLAVDVALPLRGGRQTVNAGSRTAAPDTTLVAALRRAHAMVSKDTSGQPVLYAAPTSPYDRRILNLAFLAPDIQRAIVEGTLPPRINLEHFIHSEVPLDWDAQRARFC